MTYELVSLSSPEFNGLRRQESMIAKEMRHSGASLEKISLQCKVGIARPNGPINFAGGSLVFHRLNFGNCSEASYLRSR